MDTPGSLLDAILWYGNTFLGAAPLLFTLLGLILWSLAGLTHGCMG